MKLYEMMVVIDSSPDAEKIDQTVAKIEGIITEKKGKILSVDNWGRRRLAYEIQRRQYGFYALFKFEIKPGEIVDLNRLLRLNPMVLRHLILVLDPKIAEKATTPAKVDSMDKDVEEKDLDKKPDEDIDSNTDTDVLLDEDNPPQEENEKIIEDVPKSSSSEEKT
jgi:small subunit ribosomal protein S6